MLQHLPLKYLEQTTKLNLQSLQTIEHLETSCNVITHFVVLDIQCLWLAVRLLLCQYVLLDPGYTVYACRWGQIQCVPNQKVSI